MANGKAFDDAVRIAADKPGLGVGIHVSLVDEQCVARPAQLGGLVDADGRLPKDYHDLLLRWSLGRFNASHIRTEIAAQISRVLEAGIKPTHLDSHQHLHLFPPILTIVLEAAASAKIAVVRLSDDRSPGRGFRGEILARLSRRALPRVRVLGIHTVDHFWGLVHSGSMNEAKLLRLLERLKNGVNEIMCHPGFSDPPMRQRYPWRYHWEDETAALTSAQIAGYIRDHRIRLSSFRDAWNPSP